ncbi:hypothetical protein [Actinoplanes sp. NPDC023714]|uniref:hypothetical protein n=1 Tax=Actinoplanes sp. NPDC023714 TaxID=3154322 RepID=UPI00340D3A1C
MDNGCTTGNTKAAWWLNRGETSASYYYFYDVDAFRVRPGCVLDMNTGFGTTRWDRRGLGPLWVRIGDSARYTVTYHQCF